MTNVEIIMTAIATLTLLGSFIKWLIDVRKEDIKRIEKLEKDLQGAFNLMRGKK